MSLPPPFFFHFSFGLSPLSWVFHLASSSIFPQPKRHKLWSLVFHLFRSPIASFFTICFHVLSLCKKIFSRISIRSLLSFIFGCCFLELCHTHTNVVSFHFVFCSILSFCDYQFFAFVVHFEKISSFFFFLCFFHCLSLFDVSYVFWSFCENVFISVVFINFQTLFNIITIPRILLFL